MTGAQPEIPAGERFCPRCGAEMEVLDVRRTRVPGNGWLPLLRRRWQWGAELACPGRCLHELPESVGANLPLSLGSSRRGCRVEGNGRLQLRRECLQLERRSVGSVRVGVREPRGRRDMHPRALGNGGSPRLQKGMLTHETAK